MFRVVLRVVAALAITVAAGAAPAQALRFGVLNQRSPQLIAQYWNPILEHVSRKSGAALEPALMPHPRLPAETVARLRAAFVGMSGDAEGAKVLAAAAAVIGQKPPFGFVGADNRDYDNYRRFCRTTLVRAH